MLETFFLYKRTGNKVLLFGKITPNCANYVPFRLKLCPFSMNKRQTMMKTRNTENMTFSLKRKPTTGSTQSVSYPPLFFAIRGKENRIRENVTWRTRTYARMTFVVKAYCCNGCGNIFQTAEPNKIHQCNKCGGELILFDRYKTRHSRRKSGRRHHWFCKDTLDLTTFSKLMRKKRR